ncbi:hypothetical protein QYE76_046363 [Lolium multiflorum]|uniref:Uncharacterized protein n=1 Tax=Lolium multiflorum TaxID=4521 RepID=A0AAD8WYK0_LOLMU|nr:hypothetical protein QYE76_046363 [Lolium multiflorum]
MENYSSSWEQQVMKMAVEMAAVSMEKPSGGTSPSRVPEQRLLSPDLGFAMARLGRLQWNSTPYDNWTTDVAIVPCIKAEPDKFSPERHNRWLFVRQGVEDGDLSQKEWTADHVDPADQAGDDDLPEADDQGGQGEHNPPPSPEQGEDEPASSTASPIRAVPLTARPPSTSATSSSVVRGKKRASSGRSTAALEARAQKQRRLGPKKGCYQVCPGCRLWLGPCGGFGAAAAEEGADSAAAVTPTYAACCSAAFYGGGSFFSCTFPGAPGSGTRGEPAPRGSQPTLDQMFPRHVRLVGTAARAGGGAGGAAPPAAGVGGPAPEVVVLDAGSDEAPPAPDSTIPTGPAPSMPPPPSSEPARDEPVEQEPARDEPAEQEPARAAGADARALVTTRQGSALPPDGLHVAKAAMLTHVVSAPESSLGSAGTMEKDWHRSGACEVTGTAGQGWRLWTCSSPASAPWPSGRPRRLRPAWRGWRRLNRFRLDANLQSFPQTVADRRTAPYNRLVVGYHKAKNERAEMAPVAARVPQLEADLRAARERCATAEETAKTLAAKAQETDGELERLRRLESNHLAELKTTKENGRKEVEDLSRRLKDVEQQCRALRDEVTSKSQELTDTAKRWVVQMSALDRGLAASMAARVEPITKLGWELRKAAEELARLLWPTETLPQELGNFIKWLETAPDRFLDWKESAARAGADMALSFVLSWYNEVSLDQLEYRRADVEEKLPAENKTTRLARACAIAAFVDKGIFISDPNPPEDDSDEEPEDEEIEMESPPGAGPTGPSSAGA